jgi:alginate O-acetyltransferase complex protein AlgI
MVFSSPVFLFIFFPLFYTFYFLLPRNFRNNFILLSSCSFYLLGAGALSVIAISLLIFNWLWGRLIRHMQQDIKNGRSVTVMFVLAVVLNLMPLIFFKYLVFFSHVLSDLTGLSLSAGIEKWGVILPLGISFYTFHFLSYLADVYARRIQPEASLQKFAIYIFLFPHLIAGPVVRYAEIKEQLDTKRRRLVKSDVFWGMALFVIGLSKKVLIADPLGGVVDIVHRPDAMLTTYSVWLAAICYTFQIYFDFSGYTDMAIGMARMMGFRFPRNFNRPYAARSMTEFWQRWHMTLSRWFRDYVYIPLGGNRTTSFKIYRNLFVVFGLCALWHGAAYTFLAWGLGHGLLMTLERIGMLKTDKLRMGSLPVFFFAMLLWIPFRAENLTQAGKFLSVMFMLDPGVPLWADANLGLADPKIIFLLIISFIICLSGDKLFYRLRNMSFWRPSIVGSYCFILYILACISAVERGFNPFIYFQF